MEKQIDFQETPLSQLKISVQLLCNSHIISSRRNEMEEDKSYQFPLNIWLKLEQSNHDHEQI